MHLIRSGDINRVTEKKSFRKKSFRLESTMSIAVTVSHLELLSACIE